MKEITRVHLAKTPYSIEVDARKLLEVYLHDIETVMKAEPENMREIEARIVELLAQDNIQADGLITAEDIVKVMEHMGSPTTFSEEAIDEDGELLGRSTTKRLMRDIDGAVFGGVCAGVAAYFGISPLWIRLLAIVSPFVTAGTAILFYILLWVVIPPARTAAERLQMRGEPVTLEALRHYSAPEAPSRAILKVLAGTAQIVMVVSLIVIAFGGLIATVVGGVFGFSAIAWMDGFMARPWALGLLISSIVSGLSLVLLASLFAQSTLRWRISKRIGTAMIVLSTIGALSISGVALFGVQTSSELLLDEQRMTKVVSVELPKDLTGVKYVRSPEDGTPLAFDNRSQTTRAELRYIAYKDGQPPKVIINRDGETLAVQVAQDNGSCSPRWLSAWAGCFSRPIQVTFYGVPFELEPAPQDEVRSEMMLPDQE